jgi:hypothetical protein
VQEDVMAESGRSGSKRPVGKRTGGAAAKPAAKAQRGVDAEAIARNEKMLHARIPESLDREIKRRAGSLGMSVSTIVRHVLLNTFNLVEDIVLDSTNAALSITGDNGAGPGSSKRKAQARDTSADADDPIIGWQEAVLNLNAVCDRCNAILATGDRAAIAIREQPGPRTILCNDCLAKTLKSAARTKAPRSRGEKS